MKRILFLFISLMICVCGYSQKHMKFQGIEIDGTKKAFVDQLIKKGYRYQTSVDNGAVLTGTFTSKTAQLIVAANSSDIVIGVNVALPDNREWKGLVNEYDYYKNLYTQKYGMPVSVTEKDKSISDNNGIKIMDLVNGEIVWECWFETEEGEIQLSIKGMDKKYEEDTGFINIMYRDKENFKKNQSRDIDDI